MAKDEFEPSKEELKKADAEIKAYKKQLEREKLNEFRRIEIDPELERKTIMDGGKFILKIILGAIAAGLIAGVLYVFYTWLAWVIIS